MLLLCPPGLVLDDPKPCHYFLCLYELLIEMKDGTLYKSPFRTFSEAEDAKSYIDAWFNGSNHPVTRFLRIFGPEDDEAHLISNTSVRSAFYWTW